MNTHSSSNRLEYLKRLIERGEYQVDSLKVARKIVMCLFPQAFVEYMKKRKPPLH